MTKMVFPKDFLWGAATAAYQIEGATFEDGRGESVWDRFAHTPGKIKNGDTGDVACDHYHRYKRDVALMKEIGLAGYRFSLAWPRLFPEGTGRPNPKGVDFYNSLIDELLAEGIEPAITLNHWDLPQALQELGGWEKRDLIEYFLGYADFAFETFGDRVKKWITHNEPAVIAFNGYLFGDHAPGLKDPSIAMRVTHNLLVSHGKAVGRYRELGQKGEIGIALNLSPAYPATDSDMDQVAARIYDGFQNRWFLHPVLRGAYPEDMLKLYQERGIAPPIEEGDLELLVENPVDFLGINYYSRSIVRKATGESFLNLGYEHVRPEESEARFTEMNWEIFPRGLYDLLLSVTEEYDRPKIYITENGAAFKDEVCRDGVVIDEERVDYLKEHFSAAHRALEDGVRLAGYYVWSLMDNFEWSHGYSKRFGLIGVDYNTQERFWKKSAQWYREVIRNNGL